jgi:hypothetical protein
MSSNNEAAARVGEILLAIVKHRTTMKNIAEEPITTVRDYADLALRMNEEKDKLAKLYEEFDILKKQLPNLHNPLDEEEM